MVNLITYLEQVVKNKSKIVKKPTRKKKLPRVPRRGLGFGMRHRNYREYKNNKKQDTDTKLIELLTALFKNIIPQNIKQDTSLNPFIEKEKQTYNMVFEPRFKSIEDKLLSIENKKPTENIKAIKSANIVEINNKLADYETKWTDLIENQESLVQEINDIELGSMDEHIQERFRQENLDNKSDILSLQRELQEDINNAEDLNDYKSFIDFQNNVLNNSVDNFVLIDNRLGQELKEAKIGFEELQEMTEKEKQKLQIELENNENKVLELTNDLNKVETDNKKLKDKLQQYEITKLEPPRLQIQKVDEEDEEDEEPKKQEFKPPSPKPPSPKPPSPKPGDRKITPNEIILIDYVKNRQNLSKKKYNAIEQLFGSRELNFFVETTSAEPKYKRIRQLLINRGIDEKLLTKPK